MPRTRAHDLRASKPIPATNAGMASPITNPPISIAVSVFRVVRIAKTRTPSGSLTTGASSVKNQLHSFLISVYQKLTRHQAFGEFLDIIQVASFRYPNFYPYAAVVD